MGRLFWKFFIVIWIAQLLGTMSVMVAVDLIHNLEQAERRNAGAERSAGLLMDSAAATLEFGGPAALRKLMEDMARNQLMAVDENNRELLGRRVNRAALQRAQEKSWQRENASGVRRIDLADGRSYLLFIDDRKETAEQEDLGPLPPHGARLLPTEPLVAHLIASLVVAALLAHYLSRPIRSLRSAFRAISSGNLQVGISSAVEKRKDELADLLREFDRMAAQLRRLVDGQIQLFHVVSHEVRSPLARMQAAIGLARQQPERTEQLLDRIDREVMRIDRLTGELLALSRLATIRRESIDDGEVGIDELLAEIVESAQFEAESKGQRFHYPHKTGAIVRGNAELLQRAIENVVRNAVKHTQDGSRVRIRASLAAECGLLKIFISDTGPGVSEAELAFIFEPFFRGASPDSGHGLGLAIAWRIIHAHGGRIRAFNRPCGGLCVEIHLPLAHRHREAGAQPDWGLPQAAPSNLD